MRMFFRRVITDQINGGPVLILKAFLRLLSYGYAAGVQAIASMYRTGILRQHRLGRPVVSVGNITVGGVGKTPLVIAIAQMCKKYSLKPVILTRGYMGMGHHPAQSDEAVMLREVLADVPVLAGADRIKNAEDFLKNNAVDVFILDDGFQHRRLARDMDIVAMDATNPWGNGCLLPRGILREPLTALRRADWLVLTKTDFNEANVGKIRHRLAALGCRQPVVQAVHRPVELVDLNSRARWKPDAIRGKGICCFSSLGSPETFAQTLVRLGAEIQKAFNFTDHHVYNKKDIQQILEYCRTNRIATVVTTHKDAVKLTGFGEEFSRAVDIQFLFLKIEAVLLDGEGKNAFLKRMADLPQR